MSMPRAAMSVATRARILPALKLSSAATRALWLLLPWMAAAPMPCLFRKVAMALAPCLVRLNTSALVTDGSARSLASNRFLSGLFTK